MNALLLSLLFVSLCGISNALHLPVVARSAPHMPRHMMMQTYSHMRQKTLKVDENIENARDIVYATNITLGGQEFPIQLDTGSSDVWVQTPFPLNFTNTTNLTTELTFGIGEASGNVAFADMEFGPYKVPNQAFLNATNATNFNAIFSNGIFGIMGLAFDIGSSVFATTVEAFGRNDTSGLTFLSNIFLQNRTAPNMFTVLLGRSYDKDGPQEGAFTISEYVEGLEKVADEPKLFRTPAQTVNITSLPRWSVQLDSMTVNGTKFQFNQSSVPEAAPGKQVVVLDTGFTFSQIPGPAVDFIYSQMPGSFFNATSGFWVVPCNATIPMSFEFGGKSIPVHPLDMTTIANVGNNTVCVNSYRGINFPPGTTAGFDFLLGDTFLKNVYTSFDYGDFVPGDPNTGVPFVQMLATTDPKVALHEFKSVRAKQVRENNKKLNPPPVSANSSVSSAPSSSASTPSSSAATSVSSAFASMPSASAGVLKREVVPIVRSRLVIFRGAMPPPGMPIRFHHKVMSCMNKVANNVHESFGPVALALLAGTLGIALISCFLALALGIRMIIRWRRGEEEAFDYEPVAIKEDVLFDSESQAAVSYNHYQSTTSAASTPAAYRSSH